MPLLVLVRHGQSLWNLENRFTGEVDVALTPLGRDEARSAGQKLKDISFTQAFTSMLQRAIETLTIILTQTGNVNIPVSRNAALNERNYGGLQGSNKAEVAAQYGDAQVAIWRRSYSVRPPGGESLADTAARVLPYYHRQIEPLLRNGQNILVVAHGNSLRSLMMELEKISEAGIEEVDLSTGAPRCYKMNDQLQIEEIKNL
jgi:2,3-bisphosphoglycerate-dependent phosphoglycerate mutase